MFRRRATVRAGQIGRQELLAAGLAPGRLDAAGRAKAISFVEIAAALQTRESRCHRNRRCRVRITQFCRQFRQGAT
jgi:hypothetical protein